MNRRKVLKNILATFSLPFIPLGLIPKDEEPLRISTQSGSTWGNDFIDQTDIECWVY